MKTQNNCKNIVNKRYLKDSIRKYEDGWWITNWSEFRLERLKLIGSFKTKQLAENELEILNNLYSKH
jgi:hypothetical protein